MQRDSNKTKVIFRLIAEKIVAIFPDISEGAGLCMSYAIVGQHGPCSPTWIKDGGVPNIDECAGLINELQGFGYDLLFEKGVKS